jgi:hypothetical protein
MQQMLHAPTRPARDSFAQATLPSSSAGEPPPCSNACCCFPVASRYIKGFFDDCPTASSFVTSSRVSGESILLFRIIVFTYLFICGFLFVWFPPPNELDDESEWSKLWGTPSRDDTNDDVSNMPPAYLTNWGFVTVLIYFGLGCYLSIRYQLAQQPSTANAPKRREFSSPGIDGLKASFLQPSKTSNLDKPSLIHCITWYLWIVALTLQPFIVLGFWVLVYHDSGTCDYRCGTVRKFIISSSSAAAAAAVAPFESPSHHLANTFTFSLPFSFPSDLSLQMVLP